MITLATCIKLEDNQGRILTNYIIYILIDGNGNIFSFFFFKRAFTNQNTHAGV